MDKIYAIGDIHGYYKPLKELLSKLDPGIRKVFLGDYIDRGPDSKSVIETVQECQSKGDIPLKGNHEDMCVLCHKADGVDNEACDHWAYNGAIQTLKSFKLKTGAIPTRLPSKIITWMNKLPLFYEWMDYFFVHAGAAPGVRAGSTFIGKEMFENACLWIRDSFIRSDYDFGKTVVFGHTPFREPLVMSCPIR